LTVFTLNTRLTTNEMFKIIKTMAEQIFIFGDIDDDLYKLYDIISSYDDLCNNTKLDFIK